jgi:lycopene beta-cyclase
LNSTLIQNLPPQNNHYDYIIVGAGAACLQLLMHWKSDPFFSDKKILILDPEIKKNNDRTWCFWSSLQDPCYLHYAYALQSSWKKVKMGTREEALTHLEYHCLPGSKAYEIMDVLIDSNSNLDRQYSFVEHWSEQEDCVLVKAGNQTFFCQHLFSTALNYSQLDLLRRKDLLKQSFFGWWIEADIPEEMRDTAILMDFEIPQEQKCQFVYFLPFQGGKALVELTRFGVEPIESNQAPLLLEQWLGTQGIKAWKILEVEMGSIPMSVDLGSQASQGKRVTSIGTAGGLIKPSTGYGFHRMHQHAQEITAQLKQSEEIGPPSSPSGRFKFYDQILLNLLVRKPQEGQRIFQSLFKKIPCERTLDFLEEKTSFQEEISILASLPFGLFVKSFFQVQGLKLKRFSSAGLFPWVLLLLTLCLCLGNNLAPDLFEPLGLALLIGGLVFPGIPHGAVDHLLGLKAIDHWRKWLAFVAGYLCIMAAVIALWLIAPILGLLGFLLYSAWHFGQTDMQQLGIYWGPFNMLQGYGVLAFLLGTHAEETENILRLMLSQPNFELSIPVAAALSLTGFLAMGIPAFFIAKDKAMEWVLLVATMVLASQLPLLMAFGIYFVGIHSVKSWMHLQKGLSFSFGKLLLYATPFTLGAFAVGLGLYWGLRKFDLPFDQWIPYLFLFLAAISAPHIFYMHKFYKTKEI